MKLSQYILKEYGAWSVMIISYIAGIFVSGGMGIKSLPTLLAVSLFVNSKQAFTRWIYQPYSGKPLIILLL